MGVDITLRSLYDAFAADAANLQIESTGNPLRDAGAVFERMRASGGYFRNGYNSGDVMWAMGLSWSGDVGPMLTEDCLLPVERGRELIALIESRPLTDERLSKLYLAELTSGVEPHPIGRMLDKLWGAEPKLPPDYATWARFVRERREQLLALLSKSVELNEPLECSL